MLVAPSGERFGQGLLVATMAIVALVGLTGGGGISPTASGGLEVAAAALGLVAAVGVALGSLRTDAGPRAWVAVGMLAAFGFWCALSIRWSVLPEGSWLAANRALAYAVIAAVVVVAARSTSKAAESVALALTAAGLLVALYALGGKLIPWFHVGPLDLNPGDRFSRVSRPLDYWNALGLLCVMSAAAPLWVASSRRFSERLRFAAVAVVGLLVLTIALSYSRGSVVGYAVLLAVLVGGGPDRLTRLAFGVGIPLVMAPAMIVAFVVPELAHARVSLDDRTTAGFLLLAVTFGCLLLGWLALRGWVALERRGTWDAGRSRRTWRVLGGLVAAAAVVGILALAFSSRGLTGSVSHQVESFKSSGSALSNDPDRLISANSSSRYTWWEEAAGAFSDRPLTGQGAGSFPIINYLYREREAPARSSHSLPLMFLSETGLVGFALGMGALLLLGFAAWRSVGGSSGVKRGARLALLAAFTAWLVESLFDWHWEIPVVTIPALAASCTAAVLAPTPKEAAARASSIPRGAAIAAATLAAAAALALASSSYLPVVSETKRLDALDALDSDPAKALDDAKLARRLNPLSVDNLVTLAGVQASQGHTLASIASLQEATQVAPEDSDAWRQLITGYVLADFKIEGARVLLHLLVTDPFRYRHSAKRARADLFLYTVAPRDSPTAFGTPPP